MKWPNTSLFDEGFQPFLKSNPDKSIKSQQNLKKYLLQTEGGF